MVAEYAFHSQGHCDSCRYAIGFHRCYNRLHDWGETLRWRKGSLFLGHCLDPQRNIFNLHRRNVPLEVLQATCQRYVESGYMNDQTGARILQVIEQERGQQRIAGDAAASSTGTPSGLDAPICPKLSRRELEAELTKFWATRKTRQVVSVCTTIPIA